MTGSRRDLANSYNSAEPVLKLTHQFVSIDSFVFPQILWNVPTLITEASIEARVET